MAEVIYAQNPGLLGAYAVGVPYDLATVQGWLQQAYTLAQQPGGASWAANYDDLLTAFGVNLPRLPFNQADTFYVGLTPEAAKQLNGGAGAVPSWALPAAAAVGAGLLAWWFL